MTYYWDWEHGRRRYLDRLLEAIAGRSRRGRRDGYFFDGVVYHLYFTPRQTTGCAGRDVAIAGALRHTCTCAALRCTCRCGRQADLDQRDQRAPRRTIPQEPPWSCAALSPSRWRSRPPSSLQQFSLAFAGGAGRVQVYKLRNTADHPESIEPFGLLRADDTPRPAFAAFRTATTPPGLASRAARLERQGDVERRDLRAGRRNHHRAVDRGSDRAHGPAVRRPSAPGAAGGCAGARPAAGRRRGQRPLHRWPLPGATVQRWTPLPHRRRAAAAGGAGQCGGTAGRH
jgi:hypothetical protein